MNKRDVIRLVLDGVQPPYVPWSFGFTVEAKDKLNAYYAPQNLEDALDNHLLKLGSDIGFFTDLGDDCVQDVFGVVWDRSVDKDIGNVKGCLLQQPTLKGYAFPDPLDARFFADIPGKIARLSDRDSGHDSELDSGHDSEHDSGHGSELDSGHGSDRFRLFQIGFSLYERAWTLRGMQNLLMDFLDHPGFVDQLLNAIAEYNLAQVQQALQYDIDAVYFGDDWGQQHGLQMGPKLWRRHIYPVLQRMYAAVHQAGKYVFIHSCGDVDELFDDLISIGVDCFNPFQPEVMDVFDLMERYRGRLAFHGGLSTQRTLPYGSQADVRRETERLLAAGSPGGYILAPAHDVEGDVPLENMLAFIEIAQAQPGYQAQASVKQSRI